MMLFRFLQIWGETPDVKHFFSKKKTSQTNKKAASGCGFFTNKYAFQKFPL
ncbi:MAG: hypothetical protein JWP71_3098 [Mucilaginibacter sp.]|nr:hypothetical protein [Mucilaginibacter sp.]